MSWAYYNEIDPFAAEWLRRLIASGLIAPGEVDTRSIEDVRPDDLQGFTQCHFFAGIGVWSHALIAAGWPDDREVWTGSCPCQPFSAAGKGGGFADERHLWPAWFHLIGECRPPVVFGEQVASKDGLAWLDVVYADLERAAYAVGAFDFCAAGVGAPHIRQRLYFVGHADDDGSGRYGGRLLGTEGSAQGCVRSVIDGAQLASGTGALAHHHQAGLSVERRAGLLDGERPALRHDADGCGANGELADADGRHAGAEGLQRSGEHGLVTQDRGPTNGFWRDADWLPCIDGKSRPVEPGTFPLAHGAPARVGRLRAYGNAIVGPQAQAFVEAYMECRP